MCHRSRSSSSSWHARRHPRTSFLLLARALPSPRLLPPPGTHASFLLLAPVPPPPHLLPPPSTRATAALPYSSCHARRRPDLPCRTLLPGSCRRPDHISTSSGHRRAPSPPAPTPRISSWWGFITTVPDHPRPFNATNPVRSLQQHPGSGYHHVVPTVTFDGAPRLSPAAGRPTYCTMEVEIKHPPKHIVGVHERGSRGWLDPVGGVDSIHEREHPTSGVATSSFCRSPPPASVGRAPSPDSRSRHAVHRRHHSLFIADNRGRSTAQRRDLAFPLPLYIMRRFVDAQQSLQTAMLNNVNSSGSLDWSWYRIHLKLGLGTGYILSWSSSLSRWRCVYVYMCSGDRRTYLVVCVCCCILFQPL
ncbi:uncharacterized protein LOC125551425 isoform X2 [Triticum urartu]|uniref:uncharacterized protein LOC125551425 isoform X2 n=1 Tax=Triticum urartu TaxID=4572 RepID=UPI00204333C6|nr:uncharacterized protein LOC125551425 isoform X2 [Triticum urartu]